MFSSKKLICVLQPSNKTFLRNFTQETQVEIADADFNEPLVVSTGHVLSVIDGVATIDGLADVASGELIVFIDQDNNEIEKGLVLSLEAHFVKAMILGNEYNVKATYSVRSTNTFPSIKLSQNPFGRILNSLGTFLDESHAENENTSSEFDSLDIDLMLERKAVGIIFRDKITEPVNTGVIIIDSMIPIGRGQRELIIGDRQTGKTAIAVDTIINQRNELSEEDGFDLFSGLFCIYVSIGQKQSSVIQIMNKLKAENALFYTIIVMSTASDSANLQFLAPYAGCAIGEFLRDIGYHSLVIYDDLTKQAVAYRQMSLLLRRPPGREAYPGDVFYLHSRLLERSAKLNDEVGGGSLTALPIVETQAGDVSAYIPTNVISITDGQIFLETELFYKGIRPAINIGISVSRIGAAAQDLEIKEVAASLKLDLAQYREVEVFSKFGSDIDEATKKLLTRGSRLVELLKQDQYCPLASHVQAALIAVGTAGSFDTLPVSEIKHYKKLIIELLA